MATLLRVTGLVANPRELDQAELSTLPGQVADAGALVPGREGAGVRLKGLLAAVRPLPDARYVTLESTDGKFSASVPLEAVADQGVIVYGLGKGPLPATKGGPVRFFIIDVKACGVDGVDSCANVKFLGRIDFSAQPGLDQRPSTQRKHEALHQE